MLTLFSVPKGFAGKTATSQTNAIESWRRVHPEAEILLFGDEVGVAEAAERGRVRCVPEIRRNSLGTPLLGEVFRRAEELAAYDVLAFVNADIILFDDLAPMVQRVCRAFNRFLVVGRRTNLDLGAAVEFSPGWDRELRARARSEGVLHGYHGTDLFVFRRPMFGDMPDFAIGRASWDNWIMYFARKTGVPLIDATHDLLSLHQNHDYGHVDNSNHAWKGPEADINRSLAGGASCMLTVFDSTHVLRRGRVVSARTPRYVGRHVRAWSNRWLTGLLGHYPDAHMALRTVKSTLLAPQGRRRNS